MNGIILLWKECGMISYDCVFKLRKILYMKKVGYIGMLDLEVEGVFLICIGCVMKLVEYVIDEGKVYVVEIILGKLIIMEDVIGEMVMIKELVDIFVDEF